jgi:hypothetical protein
MLNSLDSRMKTSSTLAMLILAFASVVFPAKAEKAGPAWNFGIGGWAYSGFYFAQSYLRLNNIIYQADFAILDSFPTNGDSNSVALAHVYAGSSVLRRVVGNWLAVGGGAYYAEANVGQGLLLAPQVGLYAGKHFTINLKYLGGPFFYQSWNLEDPWAMRECESRYRSNGNSCPTTFYLKKTSLRWERGDFGVSFLEAVHFSFGVEI